MPKTKVFVSFDFDNDETLKHLIIGQAKLTDSPFEISDLSLKEAQPERDWEACQWPSESPRWWPGKVPTPWGFQGFVDGPPALVLASFIR